MSDGSSAAQQLRITYDVPTKPCTLYLTLLGMWVLVEGREVSERDLHTYLTNAGIEVLADENHGVHFSTRQVGLLRQLPDYVTIKPDDQLETLYNALMRDDPKNTPLLLTTNPNGSLSITYDTAGEEVDDTLSKEALVAFLHSSLPFQATPSAWEYLKEHSDTPLQVGAASGCVEGYVEIVTTKPQLLEQVPPDMLRGLFRIDPTHFGIPLAYASDVTTTPGVLWSTTPPETEQAPDELYDVPIELSSHNKKDLRSLVDQLVAYGSQAIVWESGLGRRIFALSAICALDAWPLLIVTAPEGLWAWYRHLNLLGKTGSLISGSSDAHIITYKDLARRHVPHPAASIIFDQLTGPEATKRDHQRGLHRLDNVVHAYRIAIEGSWPTDITAANDAMAILRPSEFRSDIPAVERYPLYTQERFSDHVNVYLSHRDRDDPGSDEGALHRFRRSSVHTLDPSDEQRDALLGLHGRGLSTERLLAESLEILSAGPQSAISPKVLAACSLAKAAATRGKGVAVVTRHDRTAVLIKNVLRGTSARIVVAPVPSKEPGDIQIVVAEGAVPPLSGFDEVIIVDYPWSFSTIDRAVGPAAALDGPQQVTCLHLRNTLDDKIALLAARRSELGSVTDPLAPPDMVEIEYLLASR